MKNIIYTIGYATKSMESFVLCLKKNGVTCVIDVRTSPFSKAFPLFNKDNLKEVLNSHGIFYAHFGEEFGARRNESETYVANFTLKGETKSQVSFEKVYELPTFQSGVEKVLKAVSRGYRVCFMCSEKYPVDCHRFWMVAYYFKTHFDDFDVINIISENEVQTFDQVIAKVDLEKEKKTFYKNHDELNCFSLIDIPTPAWIQWWDEFFRNNRTLTTKAQTYSNIRIGYARGGEEHD